MFIETSEVMTRLLQVPRPGAEEDSGPVDGLHLRPRAAGLPASAGPGNGR